MELQWTAAWVGSTRAEKGPALIHTVALVYESLIVAVYPDNSDSRKLKIDDDGKRPQRTPGR
jgi:hypothetical protein